MADEEELVLELAQLSLVEDSCMTTDLAQQDHGGRVSSKEEYFIDATLFEALVNGIPEPVMEWIDSLPQERRRELINKLTCSSVNWKGLNALHVACRHNQLQLVKILLEAGADPNVRDVRHGGVALLYTCRNDPEENIEELVQELMKHKCAIDVRTRWHVTPLYYAAVNGHSTTVSLLLDNGANMNVRDENGKTPIHLAADNGHVETLAILISHHPDCVHYKDDNDNTPLHWAVKRHRIEVTKKLIKCGANVAARNSCGETPLHLCAGKSGPQLVRLLLDAGAEANNVTIEDETDGPLKPVSSPLYKACHHGNTDNVILLMQYGAVADAECLDKAIQEGYEKIVVELLKCPHWPELLRHTIEKQSTPFREMIKKMPAVAEDILNHCTVLSPVNSDCVDEHYEVVFNYEFIEDMRDESEMSDGVDIVPLQRGKKQSKEKKNTYGVSFMDLLYRSKKNYSTNWGPVGFKKSNHPLALMVETGRSQLLTHPLVGSLLHHKWTKFGQIGYFLNLFPYCGFLTFLTIFALLVPNPQTTECEVIAGGLNNTTTTMLISCGSSLAVQIVVYISAGSVILCAFIRLLLEFFQLIVLKFRYFTDWINYMELVLYLSSIIFVWIFNTRCQCPYNWQWQIGVVAVFLAWINLIVFFSKSPLTGVYVLMFLKIFYTFLKIATLSVLLVAAFGLTFYMAFYEPSITRSPFSHPAQSLLMIMTMTTGEIDFVSHFRLDPTGMGDNQEEIPFPPISYILWIAFVILMPILFTNMLVGLAVGDINVIQDEAAVTRLALQVEQVLTIEDLLPKKLRRQFVTSAKSVYPNHSVNLFKRFLFFIWGGERYDSHNALNRVLNHQKAATMGTKNPALPELKILLEEMNEIKLDVQKTMSKVSKVEHLIQELAKKHGVPTQSV